MYQRLHLYIFVQLVCLIRAPLYQRITLNTYQAQALIWPDECDVFFTLILGLYVFYGIKKK